MQSCATSSVEVAALWMAAKFKSVARSPARERTCSIPSSDSRVLVGAQEAYEARCRHCFKPEGDAKVEAKHG